MKRWTEDVTELDRGREEVDGGRDELGRGRDELDGGREEVDGGRDELDGGREEPGWTQLTVSNLLTKTEDKQGWRRLSFDPFHTFPPPRAVVRACECVCVCVCEYM